ncbi:MAG: hypothetical protein H0V65_05025, partial [Chitinophagales bacterium]|nr:hypothetical protein [Chitinophagales bacterium]
MLFYQLLLPGFIFFVRQLWCSSILKRVSCTVIFIILALSVTYSTTVTGLTASFKFGQVFLTWNKNTSGSAFFLVYRSTSPITSGTQLSSCEYLGYVNDSSSVDHNISKADKILRYIVIDSAGVPLQSSKGLFVATTEDNGTYYYAVTVSISNVEDKTIIAGSNSLQTAIIETVHAPRAVFREIRIINGKSIEIYTWFQSMKVPHGPLMNKIGFLAYGISVNRNNATLLKPLRYRFHPGGQTFLSNIDNTNSDEVLINVEDYLPHDKDAGWWGTNGNYNFYKPPLDSDIPPATGINYNFSDDRLLKTLNWILSKFPVDSNRVYIDGSSFGAVGAFFFPLHHPEKIAAAKVSVGIFNLGFLNDYNPKCTFNPGEKNRVDGDLRLGTVASNLPTNVGFPTYSVLNGSWWFHQFNTTDFPVFYTISGKQDELMGWTEKVAFYDSVNANRIGGYFFWDNRDHGGTIGKTWDDSNFSLYRYRKNRSFPAFSYCSVNENPGNGNGTDGALFGSINGCLDWNDNSIIDESSQWNIKIFTRNLKKYTGEIILAPDSCSADVTPRRLQQFQPQAGNTLSWKLYHKNQLVQSGTIPYSEGLIVIPQVKIYKDT